MANVRISGRGDYAVTDPQPVFCFAAVTAGPLHVIVIRWSAPFSDAITASPAAAWTVTIDGSPATTTGAVVSEDGITTVVLSGTPLVPQSEGLQEITVAYTRQEDGTDLIDIGGRPVPSFTAREVIPRLDNEAARFIIVAEQGSVPATPGSGFLAIYADSSGNLHYINDAGVNLTLNPSNDQFILAAEVFG